MAADQDEATRKMVAAAAAVVAADKWVDKQAALCDELRATLERETASLESGEERRREARETLEAAMVEAFGATGERPRSRELADASDVAVAMSVNNV